MQSPATHNLWKHRTQLRWHHGVLQYQWDYGAWQSWLLVVPSQLKEEMLVHFHDAPTGGHFGATTAEVFLVWYVAGRASVCHHLCRA